MGGSGDRLAEGLDVKASCGVQGPLGLGLDGLLETAEPPCEAGGVVGTSLMPEEGQSLVVWKSDQHEFKPQLPHLGAVLLTMPHMGGGDHILRKH